MAVPYQKSVTANAYKNNSATILFGNRATGATNATNTPGLTLVGYGARVPGAKVVTNYTQKSISGGVFAGMERGYYIMMRNQSRVAGTALAPLQSGGSFSQNNKSINYTIKQRSYLMVTAGWNYVTGRFLTTPTAQQDKFDEGTFDGTGADLAGTPTRAVPGRLVYLQTGKNATAASYEDKTG